MPGVLEKLVEWLKMYKTTDGKDVNVLASDTPTSAAQANKVIAECHDSWKALKAMSSTTQLARAPAVADVVATPPPPSLPSRNESCLFR